MLMMVTMATLIHDAGDEDEYDKVDMTMGTMTMTMINTM